MPPIVELGQIKDVEKSVAYFYNSSKNKSVFFGIGKEMRE
jgi:hypothetical protein